MNLVINDLARLVSNSDLRGWGPGRRIRVSRSTWSSSKSWAGCVHPVSIECTKVYSVSNSWFCLRTKSASLGLVICPMKSNSDFEVIRQDWYDRADTYIRHRWQIKIKWKVAAAGIVAMMTVLSQRIVHDFHSDMTEIFSNFFLLIYVTRIIKIPFFFRMWQWREKLVVFKYVSRCFLVSRGQSSIYVMCPTDHDIWSLLFTTPPKPR